ncbi:MAG: alanine dehydrogenase [Anaerolineae bacterium]|nr:alanine dehydrogenase [Anaerolineae bacterium]
MIVAIPKEVKKDEYRIAVPPDGVGELSRHGHQVLVQAGGGEGSGFTDQEYVDAGATIYDDVDKLWRDADMVVKVKEPQPSEYGYLRPDLILFTYLHLAAEEALTRAMCDSGVAGVAYETVEDAAGRLPLLEPMSEVAGRMASQVVAHYLTKHEGGRGVLMGGVPGVRPAQVVILGGGTVGTNAARIALGMGAQVTLLDIDLERLRYLDEIMPGKFTTLYSNAANIAEVIRTADAIIGSVLIAGARAPKLVTREMLKTMPRNSVIVDVAVDQGGCIETTHPTTHSDPTFVVDGVLHYGVANMPGAVPRTSSMALSNATLRYILRIADKGLIAALKADPGLMKGLNTYGGHLTYPAVAEAFDMKYKMPEDALTQMVTI